MKIAFFTDMFLPQINGVATSIENSIRGLVDQNHEIMIFTPKFNIARKKFIYPNTQVIQLPTLPGEPYPELKVSVLGLPKVLKTLRKFNPDVIHLHTPFTVGIDAVIAAKILRKPLVGTMHWYFASENYLDMMNSELASKVTMRFGKIVSNFLCSFYNFCDLRLTPSENLIKQAKSFGYKKNN